MRSAHHESEQLPYLETFSKAAELSSFSGAAKEFRLTQAAVSQRVQSLERILGKALFKRHGGRVKLTEDGRKLYDVAQRILDLHRQVRIEISGQDSSPTGELVIAASSIPGEYFLPALLAGFNQKYPDIRVRATVTDSRAVLAQLERNEANLGLVGQKDPKPYLDFRHLANDRIALVVPPGHALTKRKTIRLKQLTNYPLVIREAGSGIRHCFEESLKRGGQSLVDLRVALELGSNEAIKEAVLQGVGVAVLSTYAVQRELKARHLCALEVSDLHCEREMYIVRDKRRVLPLPARLFLNYLDSHPVQATVP